MPFCKYQQLSCPRGSFAHSQVSHVSGLDEDTGHSGYGLKWRESERASQRKEHRKRERPGGKNGGRGRKEWERDDEVQVAVDSLV